jgi:hypothetical protein
MLPTNRVGAQERIVRRAVRSALKAPNNIGCSCLRIYNVCSQVCTNSLIFLGIGYHPQTTSLSLP